MVEYRITYLDLDESHFTSLQLHFFGNFSKLTNSTILYRSRTSEMHVNDDFLNDGPNSFIGAQASPTSFDEINFDIGVSNFSPALMYDKHMTMSSPHQDHRSLNEFLSNSDPLIYKSYTESNCGRSPNFIIYVLQFTNVIDCTY